MTVSSGWRRGVGWSGEGKELFYLGRKKLVAVAFSREGQSYRRGACKAVRASESEAKLATR